MDRSLITSAVSMGEIQKAMDTVANNLSNLNTTGFKQRQAVFSSLLEQNLTNQPDALVPLNRETPLGLREGTGSKVSGTKMDMAEGAIKQTDRPLDLALTQPDQFFTIETPNSNGQAETRYTRNGAFYLSPDASNPNQMNLVTQNGAFVLDQTGKRIVLPKGTDQVTVSKTGQLQVNLQNGVQTTGSQIGVVSISKPQLLTSAGDTTFSMPSLAALKVPVANVLTRVPAQSVSVQTGALEASNVDLTDAMTQLTTLQRSYQFNARAIQVTDDMMNLVNTIR
ncbi:MAG TPA: flagellar hook-basal body protein [Candidatus Angelobacter sp.]|nr:flagellar hook-basal body protein [Candidatus Angelobacter sp.]